MAKSMADRKQGIEELGLNAIEGYFNISKEELENLDPMTLKHLHNKARLGMQFEKEINLSTRAVEMNYIRVFRLIAEDKEELKSLIKKSIPKYYPR